MLRGEFNSSVPVPTREWPHVVDASGMRVRDRPPTASDFLARTTMPYRYAGTLTPDVRDTKATRMNDAAQALDYILTDEQNKALLDRAIFLLSQTDDGRRLLAFAHEQNYAFEFDAVRLSERDAAGLCDYSRKRIPLRPEDGALSMALTVKHELQHMEDAVSHGLRYSLYDAPTTYVAANRALEGNARVSEAVLACEAAIPPAGAPPFAFRTDALMNQFLHECPPMAQAAKDAMDLARKGDWAEFAGKVLPAYFTQEDTLAYYDKGMSTYISKTLDEAGSQLKPMLARIFASPPVSDKDILSKLTIKGKSYADRLRLKLYGPQANAMTPDGRSALGALIQKIHGMGQALSPEAAADLKVMLDSRRPGETWKGRLMRKFAHSAPPVALVSPKTTFEPIVLPGNIDGGMMTNGEKIHSFISRRINDAIAAAPTGTGIDRIGLGLEQFVHESGVNYKAAMMDAIDAGLRVPIAALPTQYLMDLVGVVRDQKGRSVTAGGDHRASMSDSQREILTHWKRMAQAGIDPVFGGQQSSFLASDTNHMFWCRELAKHFAAPSSDIKAQPIDLPRMLASVRERQGARVVHASSFITR